MTKAEAAALVAMLAAAFPSAKFGPENAAAYETGIMDLGATETHEAIGELIHSAQFLPAIAAIRQEVMKVRRTARELLGPKPLSLPDLAGPSPQQWGVKLGEMLEEQARWRRMTERFCRERGLPMPKDPGQEFIDMAQRGARGEDVRASLKRAIPGMGSEGVEEQEELERRFP